MLEGTEDLSRYTKAALFRKGAKTDMLARFWTASGGQGSPDTWPDPRGFTLKFYTSEGNFELWGNNTPVFFIRHAIKFPHFIRSQKRLPGSRLRSNAYAHRNRIGTNFHQLPVNRPRVPVNSYMFDGSMTFSTGHHAVYAPYSDGLPFSDLTGPVEDGWETDGPMVRSAFQVRTGPPVRSGPHPVRDVWNDAQR